MDHKEKLREQVYSKVEYIAQILGTYKFNNVILLDSNNAIYLASLLNKESIALTGQHNYNVSFYKTFDNFKVFLDIPSEYIISSIINDCLKCEMGLK